MKQVFENADKKMNKTINALTSEFAGIRAGRANPAVLDIWGLTHRQTAR